jgi:hypothetical protein
MMMKEESQDSPQRAAAGSNSSRGSEKTSHTVSAAKGAAIDQARIAQRAYELYEQRGRQEGQDLEDWLHAEQQLVGAAGK